MPLQLYLQWTIFREYNRSTIPIPDNEYNGQLCEQYSEQLCEIIELQILFVLIYVSNWKYVTNEKKWIFPCHWLTIICIEGKHIEANQQYVLFTFPGKKYNCTSGIVSLNDCAMTSTNVHYY